MINLLPNDTRESYRYAHRNRQLIRWVWAFVFALVLLGGIATYGIATMKQETDSYAKQVEAAQQILKADDQTQTEAQIKDISTSFNLVVKVLSREVLFSKLLQQITEQIPNGVVLTGLDINQDSGGIEIDAKATSYLAATQLQANLTDPTNKTFTKADLENVGCNSSGSSSYPCSVTIQALFGSNNPFLFINQKAAQ
ncbi:MAG TPA: PilN domain-containing protein [Candidatus Saccharimonadales bacterium]|nr:PilN domain-containing protein [Candidatus Saccharimonadales bacterium]